MKRISYLLSILTVLLMASCSKDDSISENVNFSGTYAFSVMIPDAVETHSRSLSQNYQDLPMHVLVFDENGFFKANQTATKTSDGAYTVDLPISDKACMLHFILGDVTYPSFIQSQSEAAIFSKLSIGNDKPAFWQRIQVDKIDKDLVIPQIQLVRNFAEVSVTSDITAGSAFTVLGYTLVHHTTEGTLAPYVGPSLSTNGGFATFQESDNYDDFVQRNAKYMGNTVGTLQGYNESDLTDSPKYMYERNQDNSDSPAYVIIKGSLGGNSTPYYYKVDIVKTNHVAALSTYMNIYRNFHYQIKIKSVTGEGYTTAEGAMKAVASNNISASIEISHIQSISDASGHRLWVSTLDTLVVHSEPVNLYYTYKDENTNTLKNSEVTVLPVHDGEQKVNSNAIQSWSVDKEKGVISVTPVATMPSQTESQEFLLYTESGLSRRIKFNVHAPYSMSVSCMPQEVPKNVGEEVTLTVQLPDNLPQSVFPLLFNIEPEKKSIYPDATKNNLPVSTTGNLTYSYEGQVTLEEYKQSRTQEFYFKTNRTDSATEITVTNSYFSQDNTNVSFTNPK